MPLVLGKWFYVHGLETMLIIGLCFTAIGFFFGYLLWRHYQYHIRRIETTNTKLRDKITVLEKHQEKLASEPKVHDKHSETSKPANQ